MQRRPASLAFALLLMPLASSSLAAGDPAAGKEKSQTCVACHGETGNSSTAQYPNLAGQYENYLYQSLKAYKSGDRQNAVMSGMVSQLSDQDMRDLAAYYASQDGLFILPMSHEE